MSRKDNANTRRPQTGGTLARGTQTHRDQKRAARNAGPGVDALDLSPPPVKPDAEAEADRLAWAEIMADVFADDGDGPLFHLNDEQGVSLCVVKCL